MARIQINDLQAPEKELSAQEMDSVTGGFVARDSTASGTGSWVYAGRQTRITRVRRAYTAYRYVSVRQTRNRYTMRGYGYSSWR